MNNAVTAKLIGHSYSQDAIGQWIGTDTEKSIYAVMRSCTRSEFYEAGRNGFRPEFSLVVNSFDYSGEDEVEVNSKRYAIYRTYEGLDNRTELYCQTKGGV